MIPLLFTVCRLCSRTWYQLPFASGIAFFRDWMLKRRLHLKPERAFFLQYRRVTRCCKGVRRSEPRHGVYSNFVEFWKPIYDTYALSSASPYLWHRSCLIYSSPSMLSRPAPPCSIAPSLYTCTWLAFAPVKCPSEYWSAESFSWSRGALLCRTPEWANVKVFTKASSKTASGTD